MNSPGEQPTRSETVCLNCGAVAGGRYCSSCGAEAHPPRLTFRSLLGVTVEHFLSLDMPMLRTAIDMLRFPGRVAAQYVAGRRRHYASPLKFNLITAAIIVGIIHYLDAEAPAPPKHLEHLGKTVLEAFALFIHWNNTFLQLIYLLALPILALIMRLLFWNKHRNVMEHYALGLYTYGEIYLIQGVCILISTAISWKWVTNACVFVSSSAPFLYYSWAATQFVHDEGRRTTRRAIAQTLFDFVRALLSAVIFSIAISVILLGAATIVVMHRHAQAPPATMPIEGPSAG